MKHLILAVVLTLCLCISSQFAVYAGPEDSSPQRNAPTEASTSIMPAREAVPTPAEAYEAMIALKDQMHIRKEQPGLIMNLIRTQRDITAGKAELLAERISSPWAA